MVSLISAPWAAYSSAGSQTRAGPWSKQAGETWLHRRKEREKAGGSPGFFTVFGGT